MFGERCQNFLDVVAGIDHNGLAACFVAKNRAIAPQHADGKDLVNHNSYTRIMDPVVRALLAVLMRWIHIASVVTLIGGFIYARFAVGPALRALPDTERR